MTGETYSFVWRPFKPPLIGYSLSADGKKFPDRGRRVGANVGVANKSAENFDDFERPQNKIHRGS